MKRFLFVIGTFLGRGAIAQNLQVVGAANYSNLSANGYYQTQLGEQPSYVQGSGGCSYERNSNTRIKDKNTIVVTPDGH